MFDWAKLALDMPGVQPEHNFNSSCYANLFFLYPFKYAGLQLSEFSARMAKMLTGNAGNCDLNLYTPSSWEAAKKDKPY